MKSILVLACSLLTSLAFASSDAQLIYDALNVEEVATNAGIAGTNAAVKTVGGLTCTTSQLLSQSQPDYNCMLNKQNDAEQIFYALNAVIYDPYPNSIGSQIEAKSAGNLTCRKTTPMPSNGQVKYHCEMK